MAEKHGGQAQYYVKTEVAEPLAVLSRLKKPKAFGPKG